MKYEALRAGLVGEWHVEAINHDSEGEIYYAIFCGPSAQERAEEYADWKNAPHDSDCAVHNAPALPIGPCTCKPQPDELGKAGDALAHQTVHSPFHERWWQARGGHDKCTVCNP